MAKKNNWIWIAIAAGVAYWWWKKKGSASSKVTTEAIKASNAAGEMVNKIVDNTTFQPDTTTMADLYKTDQSNCK